MKKDYQERYKEWLSHADLATRAELEEIAGNDKEIKERFYKNLAFGTAGLRGVLGAGTNRMNIYTVRRATQGLACYIAENGEEAKKRGVAISYDCRHYSEEFAREAACVLAANGIRAYLYTEMQPTPALSFAVRHLNAFSGIMITASHNPAEYNGYKVYGEDGAQLATEASETVYSYIEKIDFFSDIKRIDVESALNNGLLHYIDNNVLTPFLEAAKKAAENEAVTDAAKRDLKVVFTPFHGTGNKPVRRLLAEVGFTQLYPVEAQAVRDPNFSTVNSPNPDNVESFQLAIDYAKEKDADIIIGTDPDADRLGIICKANGEYVHINGNQVGVLLTEYSLSQKKDSLTKDDYIVSTVVSTNMVESIAKAYNITAQIVYTGFKFIAETIKKRENKPNGGRFLMAFEESCGYLPGTYVRDKDAVGAALLTCSAAAFYKSQGKTLVDVLHDCYKKYGYFLENTTAITMAGLDGMEKMNAFLAHVAENPLRSIGGIEIVAYRNYKEGFRLDYQTGKKEALGLEPSHVLYFELSGGGFFILRPSGTEPKIKLYSSVVGNTLCDAEEKLTALKNASENLLS